MPDHQTTPKTPHGAAPTDHGAHLPSDRDEKAGSDPGSEPGNPQHDQNRKTIAQAHADVEAGVQDTERIGTPNVVPSSSDNR